MASTIVSRFFFVYSQWKWPLPVILKAIVPETMGHKVWNPLQYPRDKLDVMPIITPAYPSINSAHNVLQSTLALMIDEFHRGHQIMQKCAAGECSWNDLFEKNNFFSRYKGYVQVIASAASSEDHIKWQGYLKSRLHNLVSNLEKTPNLKYAQPYTDGIRLVPCEPLSGSTPSLPAPNVATNSPSSPIPCAASPPTVPTPNNQTTTVTPTLETPSFRTSYFLGLVFSSVKVNLTEAVNNFTEEVKEWWMRSETMHVTVSYCKRQLLPAYVFSDNNSNSPHGTPQDYSGSPPMSTPVPQPLLASPLGKRAPGSPPGFNECDPQSAKQRRVQSPATPPLTRSGSNPLLSSQSQLQDYLQQTPQPQLDQSLTPVVQTDQSQAQESNQSKNTCVNTEPTTMSTESNTTLQLSLIHI